MAGRRRAAHRRQRSEHADRGAAGGDLGEVFARTRVGVEEGFLAAGGDSLRAVQLLARIHDVFGVELAVEDLFAAGTLAELAAWLDAGAGAARESVPLAPAPRDRELPLSFAQRRLWFLHQLEPANPVHNLGAAVRLAGRLAVPALRDAFGEIERRHEALRTVFSPGESEPFQTVLPAVPRPLPVVDLEGLPEPAWRDEARRLALEAARQPFDLQRGPVLRTALLRRRADEHTLLLAIHHIAADGGSLAVLLEELTALYRSFLSGRPAGLPDLPLQYADYAWWQRHNLRGEALQDLLAYWRGRLGGELPVLELPTDRPRPAVLSYRGAHRESLLPADLVEAVAAFGRNHGATPFMVLLAGFLALLHRYTGQEDLVVGTPVAGRDRMELEGLIGIFLNNLVLRTRVEGGSGLIDLLARARSTLLAAFSHQELPFELLVEALRPERDLSRTPLFQVMLVGQNAPLRAIELPGLTIEPAEVDAGIARFDLAVSLAPVAGGWLAVWKYSTDLFDGITLERMARHFENLVRAALADPGLPLSRGELLDAAERHQLLRDWNDTAAVYPQRAGLLHQLIRSQAERTPEALAVVFGDTGLTYRELERRAGRLARRLRGLGVGAESRVGVAMERSAELVVALLGILEAGGAYLPLDPSYPRERLAFLLADSAVEVVLTQSRLEEGLPAYGGTVLRLDPGAFSGPGEAGGEAPPAAYPGPESPAYAIYTSGSTGHPKGVLVSHRSIVNRLLWMQEAYRLDAADRVLQKTPFSFDVSVWEFFWPLLTGARLVVAPPGAHRIPLCWPG